MTFVIVMITWIVTLAWVIDQTQTDPRTKR